MKKKVLNNLLNFVFAMAAFAVVLVSSPLYAHSVAISSFQPRVMVAEKLAPIQVSGSVANYAKIIMAADDLYYAIDKSDLKDHAFVMEAICKSGLIAGDALEKGLKDKWSPAVGKCAAAKYDFRKCGGVLAVMTELYDGMFKGANLTSNPSKFTNYHYLAAMVIEEFLYKKMTGIADETKEIVGPQGGPVSMGKTPNMCIPVMAGGSGDDGGGEKYCGVSEGMGESDPSPIESYGAEYGGGAGGALGNGTGGIPYNGVEMPNCPIDAGKMGGGVSTDPTPTGGTTPPPAGGGTEEPAGGGTEEPAGSGTEEPAGGGNSSSGSGEPIPGPPPGYDEAGSGFVDTFNELAEQGGVPVGENTFVAPNDKGVSLTVYFTPNPNSDVGPTSVCGGMGGLLAGQFGGCFGSGNGSNGIGGPDPVGPDGQTLGGPDDAPPKGGTGGVVVSLGGEFCENFIKYGGLWDPVPEGDGGGAPAGGVDDGSSCGNVDPKKQEQCCAKDPTKPGCGPGPVMNDTFMMDTKYPKDDLMQKTLKGGNFKTNSDNF